MSAICVCARGPKDTIDLDDAGLCVNCKAPVIYHPGKPWELPTAGEVVPVGKVSSVPPAMASIPVDVYIRVERCLKPDGKVMVLVSDSPFCWKTEGKDYICRTYVPHPNPTEILNISAPEEIVGG